MVHARSHLVARVVAVLGLLALSSVLSACSSAVAAPAEYAVYAEHSDSNKPIVSGWNARVFNRKEVQSGTSISLDDKTGVVTLKPGLYHITTSSIVTYSDPKDPNSTLIPMKTAASGGYSRLRYLKDADPPSTGPPSVADINTSMAKAISVGTVINADTLPSAIDTFLKVETDAQVVLEHQVGDPIKDIYLQFNGNGSTWHVFARMTIQKL
jgi:hypothetical protein